MAYAVTNEIFRRTGVSNGLDDRPKPDRPPTTDDVEIVLRRTPRR
jgi:hypothetical protein